MVWDALLVRPEPTGVGRSVLELARAMSARDRKLAFVVLATYPEMFSFLDGVPHWQVQECAGARGGTLRKAIHTQLMLPGIVRRLGGNLLHSLQFIAPLRTPCPSVVTVHDLGYRHFPRTIEQPRRAYYDLLVPRALRAAARVVTNSAATAADVAATFPGAAARTTVTRFGTPSWVWGKERPAATARDRPFLFVGTLEPRKNLERLLVAYGRFLDNYRSSAEQPRAPGLVLAGGKGWHDSRLRELIRPLVNDGFLSLAGYCDLDRLWDLYCSARALLFPSLHEGFGFPILEAMAAGLPVLTADRGAMREVADGAALLVNPESVEDMAEGLARLDADDGLRQQLVTRGYDRTRFFTWEHTANSTAAVYHEVLASSLSREGK